ncbi:hypothetical protein RJB92_01175 [Staphylococcus hominis]|uniref:hypothetical protein n=1 Tax=Staphylococcus hominis TaxID=1290 RepID=UPI002878B160|nr:hypothetical protein [Staphylococcus hominis]MDS3866847.1 hypothetical protein [Staphylococcus hominis]
MWIILMSLINGEYVIEDAGFNIIPQKEYDKILPTTERVAKQIEKIYYDGEKLKLKEGETLLSLEELNDRKKPLLEIEKDEEKPIIYDIE